MRKTILDRVTTVVIVIVLLCGLFSAILRAL